jgi:hypothetical protein
MNKKNKKKYIYRITINFYGIHTIKKCDCIKIIQSYFSTYDDKLDSIIKDSIIIPTKFISLYHIYDNISVGKIFNNKLINHF